MRMLVMASCRHQYCSWMRLELVNTSMILSIEIYWISFFSSRNRMCSDSLISWWAPAFIHLKCTNSTSYSSNSTLSNMALKFLHFIYFLRKCSFCPDLASVSLNAGPCILFRILFSIVCQHEFIST